jgi:hypothetical protein
LEQFCRQAENSGNLKIDFQHYGLEERLPAKMELLAYRIIQELLNNILKICCRKRSIGTGKADMNSGFPWQWKMMAKGLMWRRL